MFPCISLTQILYAFTIISECPVRPCPPLGCEFGQKVDEEGCFLCECNVPPTPNPDCEPLECDLRYKTVNHKNYGKIFIKMMFLSIRIFLYEIQE